MTYNFDKCKFDYKKHSSGICTVHHAYQSGQSGICEASIAEYQRERWSAQNGNYWCPNCGEVDVQYMPLRCAKCGGDLTYHGQGY